jgi:hypothetical protein
MVKKPAVRNGMVRAGWELGGTDEEFEMMFEGWSPLVQRHEADQGMRSLGGQFFAGHGRSGSNN